MWEDWRSYAPWVSRLLSVLFLGDTAAVLECLVALSVQEASAHFG